jgi:hypothetical protein
MPPLSPTLFLCCSIYLITSFSLYLSFSLLLVLESHLSPHAPLLPPSSPQSQSCVVNDCAKAVLDEIEAAQEEACLLSKRISADGAAMACEVERLVAEGDDLRRELCEMELEVGDTKSSLSDSERREQALKSELGGVRAEAERLSNHLRVQVKADLDSAHLAKDEVRCVPVPRSRHDCDMGGHRGTHET